MPSGKDTELLDAMGCRPHDRAARGTGPLNTSGTPYLTGVANRPSANLSQISHGMSLCIGRARKQQSYYSTAKTHTPLAFHLSLHESFQVIDAEAGFFLVSDWKETQVSSHLEHVASSMSFARVPVRSVTYVQSCSA
jgi:hypothetical protein